MQRQFVRTIYTRESRGKSGQRPVRHSLAFLQDVFRERCEARAILVEACVYGQDEAVDAMQQAAVDYGLVAALGQDPVQAMMAKAFATVPRPCAGNPAPAEKNLNTNKGERTDGAG